MNDDLLLQHAERPPQNDMRILPQLQSQVTPGVPTAPEPAPQFYWYAGYSPLEGFHMRGPYSKDELITAIRKSSTIPGAAAYIFCGTHVPTSGGPERCIMFADGPVAFTDKNPPMPDENGLLNDIRPAQVSKPAAASEPVRDLKSW